MNEFIHRDPRAGDSSPWGSIQYAKKLAPGIVSVGTASHGGIHLSPELNAAMPTAFRGESGWYEEDCEWAVVALVYPDAFTAESVASAHTTVKNWMPDAYEAWAGVTLQPGESYKKDERAFLRAHAQDWIVTSAFGDWHESVPKDWVGVYAKPGAFLESRSDSTLPTRQFLVPDAEYADRLNQSITMFVCDPSRHPAWDPGRPKSEQALAVVPESTDDDEEELERPRP